MKPTGFPSLFDLSQEYVSVMYSGNNQQFRTQLTDRKRMIMNLE